MILTLHYIFLLAALIVFLIEVLGIATRVNLIALGLTCLTAAFLT